MTRIFQSSWFVALAGCLLYLGVTAALIRPGRFAGWVRPNALDMSPDNDPSWEFRNPEFNEWISQIHQEKATLAARQQELQQYSARLASEREEIYSLTQTVGQLQANFNQDVIRFTAQQQTNVKRQAALIAAMTPDGAAAVLDQMSDKQVVELMFVMKPSVVSAILDTMSKSGPQGAKHAADLTLMLRQVFPMTATNSLKTASLR